MTRSEYIYDEWKSMNKSQYKLYSYLRSCDDFWKLHWQLSPSLSASHLHPQKRFVFSMACLSFSFSRNYSSSSGISVDFNSTSWGWGWGVLGRVQMQRRLEGEGSVLRFFFGLKVRTSTRYLDSRLRIHVPVWVWPSISSWRSGSDSVFYLA
jgi:hypothetical protein